MTESADPFRLYEAARAAMYKAMEREADPPASRRSFEQARDGFSSFLAAAAKNRGMYRELEKKATRMRDTCQQKLEALGGNGVPSVHPTNGTLHAGGGDDAPGPRSNPVRAPSPTPVVRAPSPTPVVRAASPTPHTLRAASPRDLKPATRGPSLAPVSSAASPANRPATPSAASARPANRPSTGARRRFVADSDSDSDSERLRRERIRQSLARNPAAAVSRAAAQKTPATSAAASSSKTRHLDRRRRSMRLDSDSDDDDDKPVRGAYQTPRPLHPSTPAAKPRASRVPDPTPAANAPTLPDSAAQEGSKAGNGAALHESDTPVHSVPKHSTPAAKPRASRMPTSASGPGALARPSAENEDATGRVVRVRLGCRDGTAHGSITAAVGAAEAGSTIEIEEGEYVEQLVLKTPVTLKGLGDGVALRSAGGQTLVACEAVDVHVVGIKMLQTGGDTSRRGRSSARCVEVFQGQLLLERCALQSETGSGLIVADSGAASVKECTLRSCGKCGMLVFDGGSLLCKDSVVSGNGLYGMVVQNGGNATVEGNRFGSNKHAGILVHGRSALSTVHANDISTNGEMGVGVQSGAEVRLERNRITGNVHAGLFIDGDGSRAAASDCEIMRNGVRGIGVQSGAELQVKGCSVSSNSQEGLFVSGANSRATMQDNDLSDNGTKGVGVQSAAVAIIISNRIVRNLEEGIFVSDDGSQATIRDNNLVENGMKGIGIQSGGQADIDGNLIHNNHREGVYVSGDGSKALVQNNDITENGVKGVGIQDGADVAVEGNRISGNQYVGVHVYGENSRGIVRENDIRDNSLAAVVTENCGIVQSADNRIDGVHESDLALPSGGGGTKAMVPEGGDVSFRGQEHDVSMPSTTSSPPTVHAEQGHHASVAGVSNSVQVEVVGATDLPRVEGLGSLSPYVAISLFGPGANGKENALLAVHDALEPQVSTSVKVETLNPSWSQRFALDRLHPDDTSGQGDEGLCSNVTVLFSVHDSGTRGPESRIGAALLPLSACARTEHWLPLLGPQGEAVCGRPDKPARLHVYVSFITVAMGLAAGCHRAAPPEMSASKHVRQAAGTTPGSKYGATPEPAASRAIGTQELQAAGSGGSAEEEVSRANCKVGEMLWVIEDATEVRRLTEELAGISWNDEMEECCGTQGEVVAVLDKYVGMRFRSWASWCFVYGALRRR